MSGPFDLAGDGTPLATWQPEATCGGAWVPWKSVRWQL